jgi:hypothetical protein
MPAYPPREIARNFLSVVAGVLAALVVLFTLITFLLFTGVMSTEIGEPGEGEFTAFVSLAIAVAIASIAGGYVTGKISTRNDWIHIVLAAVVITATAVFGRDIDLGIPARMNILFFILIAPCVLIGGYFGVRKKA